MFNTPYSIAQFIIGILGAITTITCFLPQGIKTFLSKDTSGLSKWFFISALVSSAFWLTIGAMTIASPIYSNQGNSSSAWSSAIASGLPSIITNIFTVIINTTILFIKLSNMNKAKKMNINEAEYCNKIRKNKAQKL